MRNLGILHIPCESPSLMGLGPLLQVFDTKFCPLSLSGLLHMAHSVALLLKILQQGTTARVKTKPISDHKAVSTYRTMKNKL